MFHNVSSAVGLVISMLVYFGARSGRGALFLTGGELVVGSGRWPLISPRSIFSASG